LNIKDVSVQYGGVRAVSHVNLAVGEGELVGLIGPNGAGKTSLIDAITGFTHCVGRVELDGVDLSSLSPANRARRGLRRSFQTAELFDELTVRETLSLGTTGGQVRRTLGELVGRRRAESPQVQEALDLLGIAELADIPVDALSQGQRKLVDVGRAIAAAPRVVCLDEPAAGLGTDESQDLGVRLRKITEAGTGVLLVDHDMGLVLSVCDRVVVVEFGAVVSSGTPAEIVKDPVVIAAYLGGSSTPIPNTRTPPAQERPIA
jgi:branched-chain amino acid transport system ATP-binding protein